MPQFDFYSFSGQNFWLLFIFFLFYFICFYSFVLNISELFKLRSKTFRLSSNEKRNTTILLSFFDFFITVKYTKG